MKVTVIQSNPEWENAKASLARLSEVLLTSDPGTDLFVLPEMFNTGFTLNAKQVAETMDGQTFSWMKKTSASSGAAVCGSFAVSESGTFVNRMLFVRPDGSFSSYDKRHLHSPGNEHTIYSNGNKRVTCNYEGLNFNLQVCYDLRFPVWSRNRGDADVIVYSASWPEVRNYAWRSLLVARAIENQCYVIGANRVGTTPDGTKYCGESLIIDPLGKIIGSLPLYVEGSLSCELNKSAIDKIRKSLPVWKDADNFSINL
jgi:omega-amidase